MFVFIWTELKHAFNFNNESLMKLEGGDKAP